MRAVSYRTNSDISLITLPDPTPEPGDLIVQVEMCGVCGSDVMEWYTAQKAKSGLFVPGHEPVGTVVATGGSTRFKPGDRVFIHHHVPCMICARCRRGSYTLCSRYKATKLDPGGMAEFVRVPAENVAIDVLKLPDGFSSEAATLIEPIGCTIRGANRSGMRAGDTVAIVGAGINGVILTQLARLAGAKKILVSDFIDVRRDRILTFGADAAIDPQDGPVTEQIRGLNDGALADVVFVTPPGTAPAMAGLELVEPGGTLMLYAPCAPGENLPIEPYKLFFDEITVTSTYSSSPYDTKLAYDYLRTGRIRGPELVTHRFPMERAVDAFQMTAKPSDGLKAVVTMQR